MLEGSVAVADFSMVGEVESFVLFSFAHSDADGCSDYFQDDVADNRGVDASDRARCCLGAELFANGIAFCFLTAKAAGGEHRDEDRSDAAANAVDSEDIQRIVVAEALLDTGGEEPAQNS